MTAEQKLSELVKAATDARDAPVSCDLCEAPFLLAPEMTVAGQVLGLIVCSQCCEDQLQTEVIQ